MFSYFCWEPKKIFAFCWVTACETQPNIGENGNLIKYWVGMATFLGEGSVF